MFTVVLALHDDRLGLSKPFDVWIAAFPGVTGKSVAQDKVSQESLLMVVRRRDRRRVTLHPRKTCRSYDMLS